MKILCLIISLLLPGGSLAVATRYKAAFAIPIIGILWVILFSQVRWIITPTGFIVMLCGLFALHLMSYLNGVRLTIGAAHQNSTASNRTMLLSLLILVALNLSITLGSHWQKADLFGFAFYHIPSASMQSTLQIGDVVLVDTWNQQANIQDIIVTEKPNSNTIIIKRIIDRRNNNDAVELFVKGDNPTMSSDSRHFGWLNQNQIIGTARFIVFSIKQKQRFLRKVP